MASWADLYTSSNSTPLGFTLADLNTKTGRTMTDYATNVRQQAQGFDRAVGDTVAGFSARGAGRSSAKNMATNRMFEDFGEDAAQNRLQYNRALEDLQQQRRLATFGAVY